MKSTITYNMVDVVLETIVDKTTQGHFCSFGMFESSFLFLNVEGEKDILNTCQFLAML